MEGPKSRPNIVITPYSASKSSYFDQSTKKDSQNFNEQENDLETSATRSDFSTNFFNRSNKKYQQSKKNRILSDLSQIKGPTGSVRGHKDVVRKSLEGIKVAYHNRYFNYSTSLSLSSSSSSSSFSSAPGSLLNFTNLFASQLVTRASQSNQSSSKNTNNSTSSLLAINTEAFCSEYLTRLIEDEQNACVAYTTTLGVIRRTFEDSKALRSILSLNLVKFEERDIYLNQEYKFQLKVRSGSIIVPALFVDGQFIGGAKELEMMNESGEIHKKLAKFKMTKASRAVCSCCGNAKFIACQSCNGSRKSTIHHFKFNSVALRCIKCDKNDGLVQCPVCSEAAIDELNELEDEANDGALKTTELSGGCGGGGSCDGCESGGSSSLSRLDLNNNCRPL